MVVPEPGVPVEPDMAAAEAAPVRPSSPVEAIVVSSKVEAEAAPRAVTPMVSDLLCDIPNTPDVAPSSGAGHVEEASSSVPPGRIVGRVLLDDETIIEPLSSGLAVTLSSLGRTPRCGEDRRGMDVYRG